MRTEICIMYYTGGIWRPAQDEKNFSKMKDAGVDSYCPACRRLANVDQLPALHRRSLAEMMGKIGQIVKADRPDKSVIALLMPTSTPEFAADCAKTWLCICACRPISSRSIITRLGLKRRKKPCA